MNGFSDILVTNLNLAGSCFLSTSADQTQGVLHGCYSASWQRSTRHRDKIPSKNDGAARAVCSCVRIFSSDQYGAVGTDCKE